jgi:hypothetical protein
MLSKDNQSEKPDSDKKFHFDGILFQIVGKYRALADFPRLFALSIVLLPPTLTESAIK